MFAAGGLTETQDANRMCIQRGGHEAQQRWLLLLVLRVLQLMDWIAAHVSTFLKQAGLNNTDSVMARERAGSGASAAAAVLVRGGAEAGAEATSEAAARDRAASKDTSSLAAEVWRSVACV